MRRYERAATLLTSNCPVEDWGKLLAAVAPGLPGRRRRPVEQPDRVLAVVRRHAAELIQDSLFLLAPRVPIAGMDRPQVLPLRLRTHAARRSPLGNSLDGAIRGVAIVTGSTYLIALSVVEETDGYIASVLALSAASWAAGPGRFPGRLRLVHCVSSHDRRVRRASWPQAGQGRWRSKARARPWYRVAMDVPTWRSGRTGSAPRAEVGE